MKTELQQAELSFEAWRNKKLQPREKIPDELLKIVALCIRTHGRSAVAKALNLSSQKIKECLEKFPFKEEEDNKIKNSSTKQVKSADKDLSINFQEVSVVQAKNIESNSTLKKDVSLPLSEKSIVFEIENACGFKIKMYSMSAEVHQTVISVFAYERSF
jgi:hypothetical protein